jgi:GDPmannose 4,6-dehydratase
MNTALITGVTGQDGSYLADLLLEEGSEVVGMVRRSSTPNTWRIAHNLYGPHGKDGRFRLIEADLCDDLSLYSLLHEVQPDEIYHMASQSHVATSYRIPAYTADATGLATLRMLEAVRRMEIPCRFYNAGTSEMFGNAQETPQNESTPFHPRSPHAVAKVFAYQMTKVYRESYNMFACSGILFNHESPRRGQNFVTRKITLGAARIKAGQSDNLTLGNLDACRDWGYAREYMQAVISILRAPKPKDYVIATGQTHSVKEFLDVVFKLAGLDIKEWVKTDPRFERLAEVETLMGDASLAKKELGWEPKISMQELAQMMLKEDCRDLGVKM